ncbi:MAG TPA: dephospho-CoA kinase [Saprospiraceae bacterium]|nr:dephospho-CoA kinase [Saprospiraceae bacterium]
MIKVGVTGGIGSGKTTVCKIFETLGIPVYYADTRAKWLMNHDSSLKSQIKACFGTKIYHKNGRLNKTLLAEEVFANKEKLSLLNSIVHPAVAADTILWFHSLDTDYAIKEAAILIESGAYKSVDKIIVVTAPEHIRIQRVVNRDQSKVTQVKARMSNQLCDEKRIEFADYIIDNSGDKSLITQIWQIHQSLTQLSHSNQK